MCCGYCDFEGVSKSRFTSAIVMVNVMKLRFEWVDKKAKKLKSGVYASDFIVLKGVWWLLCGGSVPKSKSLD